MGRLTDLYLECRRAHGVNDLPAIDLALAGDRLRDQFAQPDSLVVGRVVGLAAQLLPQPLNLSVPAHHLTHQNLLVIHGTDVDLDLSAEVLQLGLQLSGVLLEQTTADLVRALQDYSEAHRKHGAVRQHLLEYPRVYEQLVAAQLEIALREVAHKRGGTVSRDQADRGVLDPPPLRRLCASFDDPVHVLGHDHLATRPAGRALTRVAPLTRAGAGALTRRRALRGAAPPPGSALAVFVVLVA